MCGVKSAASCRLCLASDLLPPYLDLSQDTSGQVLELCSVLALDLTVCPPHFPQLVCAICLVAIGLAIIWLHIKEKQEDAKKRE